MQWARAAHLGLVTLFLAALVVQVFFAGAGAFGATSFAPHGILGTLLVLVSLVVLVLSALARSELRLSAALFGLTVLQMVLVWLGDVSPWISALHPVNALLVIGCAAGLLRRARAGDSTPARVA